jgi:hypothetical protein
MGGKKTAEQQGKRNQLVSRNQQLTQNKKEKELWF